MLAYVLAVLAALANAWASVLQRKANKDIPQDEQMSLRLVRDLLRNPLWFAGVGCVTAGFLLQAAALGSGALAVVEPILVVELPITVLIASRMFHGRLGRREWLSLIGMTAGLVALLVLLSPGGGAAAGVRWWTWAVALGAGGGVLAALVAWGWRASGDLRAAIYGTATGLGFGLTAALMKGMDEALAAGFLHVFTAWQTYAMIATGVASMFLLQNAVNAGTLVAAQPGITLTDPIVSIVLGVLVFGETVRTGWYAGLACLAVALVIGSVTALAHSPLLTADSGREPAEDGAAPEPGSGERARTPARHGDAERARLGA